MTEECPGARGPSHPVVTNPAAPREHPPGPSFGRPPDTVRFRSSKTECRAIAPSAADAERQRHSRTSRDRRRTTSRGVRGAAASPPSTDDRGRPPAPRDHSRHACAAVPGVGPVRDPGLADSCSGRRRCGRTSHVRLPGAVGDNGQVTTRERIARNDAVVAARARGLTWRSIAERFHLEERQCRRIVDEYRSDRPLPYGSDPMTVIRETLRPTTPLRRRPRCWQRTPDMPARGLAPSARGWTSRGRSWSCCSSPASSRWIWARQVVVLDAQRVAALLVDVLERHAVPDRVVDEILTVVEDVPAQAPLA